MVGAQHGAPRSRLTIAGTVLGEWIGVPFLHAERDTLRAIQPDHRGWASPLWTPPIRGEACITAIMCCRDGAMARRWVAPRQPPT